MAMDLIPPYGGRVKSLMLLWQEFATQCGEECCVRTIRDCKTVTDRFEHEGMPFLAITLPQFCKDFERSLSQSGVDRSSFLGFTRRGELPAFLGGFLDLVFDRSTGRLLDDPNIAAIHSIRQLCLLFGKVEIPASKRRLDAAIGGYIECEQEVKRHDLSRSESVTDRFRQVSRLIFGEVLSRVDSDLKRELDGWDRNDPDWPYIHPKHGPGATADRLGGNAKWDLAEWPARLESVFPYGEYLLPNWRYYRRCRRVDFLEPGRERASKLVAVPKTLKTPRLIATEPTAMQYMQQAVKGLLVKSIQEDSFLGKMIGFDDQEANHRLSKIGSVSGAYATLDLSEASDRVSNQLVNVLFSPISREAVQVTRTLNVDVPGYGKIAIAKFASMGSALTFPVEAMVFLTAVFMGVEEELKRPLTRKDVDVLSREVRVYGDDIIVPVDYTVSVIRALEGLGLKVNVDKSFWTGKFRESCGKEYYDGHDVSVVRVRHLSVKPGGEYELPSSRRYDLETESLVSLRNRCYVGGWWRVAKWLDSWLNSLLSGIYPTVLSSPIAPTSELGARSHGLVRWSLVGYSSDYSLLATQAPVVRCWVRHQNIPESILRDEGALTKVLSYRGVEPMAADHLDRAGRPTSSTLKRRWTLPF